MIPHRPVAALLILIAGLAAEDAAPQTAPPVEAKPAAPAAAAQPAAPATAPAPAPAAEVAPAAAAPATNEPGLGLDEAIALALRGNETSDIAIARIRRAQATVERARSALLPQLTLGGSLSTSATNNLPHGGAATEAKNWTANASLTILNPAAWSNYAASRDSLQAQQFDSLDLRRGLAYATSDVFLSVIASEQQVVAAQRRLEVSRQAVADAKARLQAGLSTRTDVTRAELTEAQSQLALTQAQGAVTSSRLALGDLVVREQLGPLAQPGEIDVKEREIRPLLTLAMQMRPDLKALYMRTAAAENARRAANARYVPTVSAQAAASHTDSQAPAYATVDDKTEVTLSLVATWTLYDGGDREGAIGQTVADEREANLTYTAQARGLKKDLLTALANLETAEASLAQAEASDRLARANADEVRARYKQGLATALEDADAISGQFDAESALVAAHLDLSRAKLALRKVTGYWPLTDRVPGSAP